MSPGSARSPLYMLMLAPCPPSNPPNRPRFPVDAPRAATVMPMPVSQGASWNLSMVEDIGRINALELRSSGGDQGLSPILQVCTDPRFSRMEENFGEDPMLVAAYGVAALQGLFLLTRLCALRAWRSLKRTGPVPP